MDTCSGVQDPETGSLDLLAELVGELAPERQEAFMEWLGEEDRDYEDS